MILMEATGARWPSRSSKPAAAPLRGRLGSTPRRFRHSLWRVARSAWAAGAAVTPCGRAGPGTTPHRRIPPIISVRGASGSQARPSRPAGASDRARLPIPTHSDRSLPAWRRLGGGRARPAGRRPGATPPQARRPRRAGASDRSTTACHGADPSTQFRRASGMARPAALRRVGPGTTPAATSFAERLGARHGHHSYGVRGAPRKGVANARRPPPGAAVRTRLAARASSTCKGVRLRPQGRGRSGSSVLQKSTATACNRAYSMRRISPARGPFCESSGVNSTRCPSRSSSNTVPRTELRWKKCSSPDSSRMNPNPLSMRSRAIVPVGIPVSSDSEFLRTSQELPHPQIPVVSDNEARTKAGAGGRGNGNRPQV